ncbi:MAG: DUF2085 domain-containing protein [Thermoanaerobaculia bacterium]
MSEREIRIAATGILVAAAFLPLAAVATNAAIVLGAPSSLRVVFHAVCHGIPDRCLLLFGVPLPLCGRCFGFYCGVVAGIGSSLLFRRAAWWSSNPRLWFLLMVPMAIDGVLELFHVYAGTNLLRAATGVAAGAGIGLWAMAALTKSRCAEQPHRVAPL